MANIKKKRLLAGFAVVTLVCLWGCKTSYVNRYPVRYDVFDSFQQILCERYTAKYEKGITTKYVFIKMLLTSPKYKSTRIIYPISEKYKSSQNIYSIMVLGEWPYKKGKFVPKLFDRVLRICDRDIPVYFIGFDDVLMQSDSTKFIADGGKNERYFNRFVVEEYIVDMAKKEVYEIIKH